MEFCAHGIRTTDLRSGSLNKKPALRTGLCSVLWLDRFGDCHERAPINGCSRNAHSACGLQGRCFLNEIESLLPNKPRQANAEAHSSSVDLLHVLGAVREPCSGLLDPRVDQQTGFDRFAEELRRRETECAEFFGWQVTTAGAQVCRHVPEDVHQLQALSEKAPVFQQYVDWDPRVLWNLSVADSRPEFAHATCHRVSIADGVLSGL